MKRRRTRGGTSASCPGRGVPTVAACRSSRRPLLMVFDSLHFGTSSGRPRPAFVSWVKQRSCSVRRGRARKDDAAAKLPVRCVGPLATRTTIPRRRGLATTPSPRPRRVRGDARGFPRNPTSDRTRANFRKFGPNDWCRARFEDAGYVRGRPRRCSRRSRGSRLALTPLRSCAV